MVELLTDMWMYLAGAALIGLVIGWAFRGAFLPRPKTVNVAPMQAISAPAQLTEEQKAAIERAEQSDAAISALEMRVKTAQEAAAALQGEVTHFKTALQAAEAKIAELEKAGEKAEAPVAVAATADDENAKLIWQNRYLEARVRHLQTQLDAEPAAPVALAAPVEVPQDKADDDKLQWHAKYLASRVRHLELQLADKAEPKPVVADTSVTDAMKASLEETEARLKAALSDQESLQAQLEKLQAASTAPKEEDTTAVSLSDFSKLQWQNKYLQARLLHLEETSVGAGEIAAPVVSNDTLPDHELETLQSENKVLKAELERISNTDSEAEKELARLRWRNRYLEGRLNYLEAASLDATNDADDDTDSIASVLSDVAAPVANNDAVTEPEPVVTVAEADEVRPLSLDAPREGGPDDLKRIGGVGPKIEGILNDLGIFHFDQVASWSNEEAAWIDSYLRFQGRVQREKWVDQAASLQKAKLAAAE